MRLVYFARVREAIGLETEYRDLPLDVQTVGDCVIWLAAQSDNYALAFSDTSRLRYALDQQLVWDETLLEGAEELAIFPPVTGG